MRRREFLVASAATLTLPAVARGEKGSVLKFIPFFDTPLDPVWDPSAGFHGIMVFDTRRARRLALSRGLGHADVWDAAEPHQRLPQLTGEEGDGGVMANRSNPELGRTRQALCAIAARKSVWEPGCGLHQGQRS